MHLLKRDVKDFKDGTGWTKFYVIGSNFAAGVAVLGFIGYWMDRWLHRDRLFFVIGSVLGILWGTYEMVRIAMLSAKE